MNPQDPLAALHPLREPELVDWWPLALGWWLLLFVALLATAYLIFLLYRQYRRNAYRRLALSQLAALEQTALSSQDRTHAISELNALLKSVALRAYPRQSIAACHGEAWLSFLNSTIKSGAHFDPRLATAAYEKDSADLNLQQAHRAARHWIKHHRRPS